MFNDKYLSEVNFWRDFLSSGNHGSIWTLAASQLPSQRSLFLSTLLGQVSLATPLTSGTNLMKKTSSRTRSSTRSTKVKKTTTGTTKRTTVRSSPLPLKLLPLELSAPRISTDWLAEPELVFGQGRTATDPKVGIALYGPKSLGSSRTEVRSALASLALAKLQAKHGSYLKRAPPGSMAIQRILHFLAARLMSVFVASCPTET